MPDSTIKDTSLVQETAKHRDRALLIDGVQLAKLRHELACSKFSAGTMSAAEFINARDQLAEAEAALRAHVEVYGEVQG